MTAFRLFSRLNTFYGMIGQLLAGGKLKFYNAGTTTPRNVYGDPGLTINNGTTVQLDSSGRPNVDVWGQGAYFVEVFDSLNVKQGEADNVQIPGDGGATIPALESGKYLTNNGAVLLWSEIRELPDPTGQANKTLGTDGTLVFWEPKPTAPPAAVVPNVDSVRIRTGGDTDWLIQKGTGTAPASGLNQTTLAVTFPTPFKTGTMPSVSLTGAPGKQPGGPVVAYLSAPPTATGFTAEFDVAEGNTGAQNIVNPVVFQWIAQGQVPAA